MSSWMKAGVLAVLAAAAPAWADDSPATVVDLEFTYASPKSKLEIVFDKEIEFEKNVSENDKQVIIDIPSAKIGKKFARRTDTSQHKSNIAMYSPYQSENRVRVVLQLKENGGVEVSKDGKTVTALIDNLQPASKSAELSSDLNDPEQQAALPDAGDETNVAQASDTQAATQVSGGHAPNALPQEARALVNCRALPGHAPSDVEAKLVAAVADPGIEVVAKRRRESSPPARVDEALLATVTRISASLWPGVPVIPTLGTGATDSTYFRLAGIPAYGVSGLFDDLDDYRAHGRDERLGVAQFYDGLEFLRRLVGELAVAP